MVGKSSVWKIFCFIGLYFQCFMVELLDSIKAFIINLICCLKLTWLVKSFLLAVDIHLNKIQLPLFLWWLSPLIWSVTYIASSATLSVLVSVCYSALPVSQKVWEEVGLIGHLCRKKVFSLVSYFWTFVSLLDLCQVLLGLSILKIDLKCFHDYRCFCTELLPETLPVVIERNGFP